MNYNQYKKGFDMLLADIEKHENRNDEIMKLAAECGFYHYPEPQEAIEAFYNSAFNAGLEAAATTVCECVVTQMTGGLRKEFYDAIQKMKK